ncbi:MAG: endonuclease/exonuclease/phosphatase family protein [Bacteroidota bacterium]
MKKIFTLLFWLLTFQAFSQVTYVYFQNNTSLSFGVSCTQTGDHVMSAGEWWGMSGSLIPWTRNTNVLWTNRETGVHNGNTFYHTVFLTSAGETVQLKLKMEGNLIGSDIWASAAGPGFSDAWFSDRSFHTQNFTLNGKSMTIKYTFYFTGGFDDVLYTIQENDPFPIPSNDLSNARKLNVLTQNAYMRPSELFFDDQDTRKHYYDDLLHNYDAIIFQEMLDDDVRADMLAQLSAEYPYQTQVVDVPNHSDFDPIQDGGVLIISRWPLEAEDQYLFGSTCHLDDCTAYKGFKYCKMNKLGVRYHLFGTHMDAFNEIEDVNIRKTQLQMARSFINSKSISTSEAVLFGGDLNIDKLTNKWGEYDSLWTNFFGAQMPTYIGGLNASWDTETNTYLESTSDAPEYLDYVLAMKPNLLPTTATNQVTPYRTVNGDMWEKFDISDHYGVRGVFQYPGSAPSCPVVSSVSVSNITQTSATVSWNMTSSVLGYNVRLKQTVGTIWTNMTTAVTNINITGLTAGTNYEVQIQTKCDGLLTSAWSPSTNFTTLSIPSCADVYEANNTRAKAKAIPLNTNITAQIGLATDEDWFKFSNTTAQKNIIANLTNLPANYNLQLYDSKGNLLATSANGGTTNEQVTYNASKAATFYVRVYGVSGAFSSSCYTLKVSLSNISLKTDEIEEIVIKKEEEIIVTENTVKLYPNPAGAQFTMDFMLQGERPLFTTVYDLNGRIVSQETFRGTAGANTFSKNIEDLVSGLYIVILSDEKDILYKGKFAKQ